MVSSVLGDLWYDLKSWLDELPDNARLSPEHILEHMTGMEEEYI
jgi:hypothetical protein